MRTFGPLDPLGKIIFFTGTISGYEVQFCNNFNLIFPFSAARKKYNVKYNAVKENKELASDI